MKSGTRSIQLKNTLDAAIKSVVMHKEEYVSRPGFDFTRNRKAGFEDAIRIVLSLKGNSIRKELTDLYPDITERMTPSALVQARGKIKPEAFIELFKLFNSLTSGADAKTYNGYRLFAVDGSAINVFRNPNAETYFPYKNNQGDYNQLHLNGLFDICNLTYADVVIQPRPKMNEHAAAKAMINRNTFPENSILLADRGYGSFNLFETVNRKENLSYLFRVSNTFSKETQALGDAETDIDVTIEIRTTQTQYDKKAFAEGMAKYIPGPSKFGKAKTVSWDYESPHRLAHRIVKFRLSTGEYETIITNLPRDKFPASEIKKLYSMRWGIETSFRELKYAQGMSCFHSKREDFVLQEIYAGLLMYNFAMRIANTVTIPKRKEAKYEYQINYTHAIQISLEYFRHPELIHPELEIQAHVLPIRPGRSDRRKQNVETCVDEYGQFYITPIFKTKVIAPKKFTPFVYRVA